MKVTLVSSSQPSAELAAQGIANAQELVAYCACAAALETIFPMVSEFLVN